MRLHPRLGVLIGFVLVSQPLAAQERTYPIVDTGQSQCYDDKSRISCPAKGQLYYGQDAQYQGNQPRYRDNGDGTVTDLVTGLMWEQGFHKTSWWGAAAQAKASRAGGHDDWRVPTLKELYSLMNFEGRTGSARPEQTGAPSDARPYLDNQVFKFEYPSQGRFIDAQYVSSTAYLGATMGGNATFFGVNFADGRIKGYPQNGGPGGRDWYARYVRGNPAYGKSDYHDNGDGTVSDGATGLTWTQQDSGGKDFSQQMAKTIAKDGRLIWGEALYFCENLNFAGHADWRLPNAKELQSIVDYSRSPSATQSGAIDPVFAITAIVDDEGQTDWPYVWSSTTHLDGPRAGDFAVYFAFGRAGGYMSPQGRMVGMMNGPQGGGPGGGWGGPPGGGYGSQADLTLMDVHGAGAQRSSPKSGDESRLPKGMGPQGDVLRIFNFARCVRG